MPQVRVRKSKYISYLLRFIVAGAALYLAFRGENFTEVVDVLLGLNLWVFAGAMGFYIIGQLIFVARWSLLLKVQSIKIGFWAAVIALTARVIRDAPYPQRGLALGLIGAWVHLSVHHLVDKLYVNNIYLHLGALLGILICLQNQHLYHHGKDTG